MSYFVFAVFVILLSDFYFSYIIRLSDRKGNHTATAPNIYPSDPLRTILRFRASLFRTSFQNQRYRVRRFQDMKISSEDGAASNILRICFHFSLYTDILSSPYIPALF